MTMLQQTEPAVEEVAHEVVGTQNGLHKVFRFLVSGLSEDQRSVQLSHGQLGVKRIITLNPKSLQPELHVVWDGDQLNPELHFDWVPWEEPDEFLIEVEVWGRG